MKKFKILATLACFLACAAIAGPALAGTAYYGGFSDETGVPYWDGTPTSPTLAAQDPGWMIGEDADGTELGSFTLNDGMTTLTIPDSADLTGWVLTAEWDVPDPNAYANEHYFYIGFDPMAINTISARLGTEYKNNQFVIREQGLSNVTLAPWTEIPIPSGSHVHIRQTCVRGGDVLIVPGGDWVTEEYRVNYGPWTLFTNMFSMPGIPLAHAALGGMDNQTHYITWKVRGLGGVIDPKITGLAVPDVNIGADHDGDTVNDEDDLWPGNAAYAIDSDADDMADEWEILYFGDLSETASGNPDGDIFDNLDEFLGGSDPSIADVFTTLGQFGLMALLTALAVVGMAVLVRRRRVTA